MSFFNSVLATAATALASVKGDTVLLAGSCAATANTIAADGNIAESEIDKAISGMCANPVLAKSFTPSAIEEELNKALVRAKSRAGRFENKAAIEKLMTRPVEQRQLVFLVAADVADDDGIGAEERKALGEIAKALNVDDAKLLA